MPTPTTAPAAPSHTDRAVRLLAAIRVALIIALTALVLAIASLAYVVSFEAIRAFAIETAAFPPELAWSAPLLVDSFTTAATAVSVALNVAHAPRPASRPAVRRPAPGRPAGSAGAADERGPHRPAAHQPHTRCGGRDRRGRHRA
jgi:Protein of unknown function (DUF2637)